MGSSYRPTLPLPPNFFTCPPLHDDEIKQLKLLAIATATEVVEHSQLRDGGIAWTLRSDEGSMRFFKAPDPLHRVGAHMYMSVVEVAGTLDEVIDLFRTDSTFKAKEYVKRFGKGLLDAVNLYSIVEPTPAFPNEKVGITWFAMKSPFDKIVANRDCVMLECQHEFQWTTDRRAWVRGLRSVDLVCCPDMQSTLGLVRSTQYGVGHVVLESLDRPGYLQISFLNHFDVKGNPPEWLIEMGMKKRCRSILDIELYLREDRLSRGYLLSPAEFVPLTRRRHCFLCRKRFNPWSKRSNCMKCGEVLCSGCNSNWNVKLHNGTVHAVIQACIRCAQRNPISDVGTDATSSMTTRSHASNPYSYTSHPRSHAPTHDSHTFRPNRFDPAASSSSASSESRRNQPSRTGTMHSTHDPLQTFYPPLDDSVYTDPYQHNHVAMDSHESVVSSASSASVWTTSSDFTKKLMPRFTARGGQRSLPPQGQRFQYMEEDAQHGGKDPLVNTDDRPDDVALDEQDATFRRNSSASSEDGDGGGSSQQGSRASVWLTLSQGRGGEFVVHSPTSMSIVDNSTAERHRDDAGGSPTAGKSSRRQATMLHRSSSLDMATMSMIPSMMDMVPLLPHNHRTLLPTQKASATVSLAPKTASKQPDPVVEAVAAAAAAWSISVPTRPSVAASSVDSKASEDLHVLTSVWTADPNDFRRPGGEHTEQEKQRGPSIQEQTDRGRKPVESALCTSPHGPIFLE
ncbi:hypothetical protein H310_10207 [Aphanomyces invadans]|uniref:FYVE-type domain-containing protein n=1 Tax=Aphanomyces invadans TaxID=157072 RepID=A0A024TQP9_9STRA|nr:hypothetical protein H310_10207 [Aphanomyces invadans]ETV96455.1 hypothetical protein H310_10207 [Aphanomyces invadans]|eukprot:XP_008874718.1 hypothetical protein H310_10207 [Aphanomyces invadans]